MKKHQFIHLHGLLAQVENYYEQETDDAVDYDEYAELGVQPTSIHKPKTDHKEAVFALLNDITKAMEAESMETEA